MLQFQSPAHCCLHGQAPAVNEDGATTPGKAATVFTYYRPITLLSMRKHSAASVCDFHKTRGLSERRLSATVHSRSSPAETCTPPNQRSRVKKKASKTSAYRRDIQGGEKHSETRCSLFTRSHIQEVFVKEMLYY